MFKGKEKQNYQKKSKSENTLDYYLTEKISKKNVNWWEKGAIDKEDWVNDKKYDFLKSNTEISEIIPDDTFKDQDIPDNFGFFETPLGTMEVGYKKNRRNNEVAFSLMPEEVEEEKNVKEYNLNNPQNYFGGEKNRSQKKFRASSISFKVAPNSKQIEKFIDDDDGMHDEQDSLLYQDEKDDERLEDLKLVSTKNDSSYRKKINEEMDNIRQIKREKEEDNNALVEEIEKFMDRLKREKINKKVDSDDAVTRRRRIAVLSLEKDLSALDLIELKRMLEKMMNRKEIKNLREFSKLKEKINNFNRKQIVDCIKSIVTFCPEILD
ncbi:MAG: hypothetical protein ACI4PR_03295 [Acutalibacteraceae bacterium]